MNLTFNGVWRMDWGFGNPNITAAFIVCLLVLAWLPAFLWRRGFWLSLLISIALGICLVHTMSRGGILGGFVGLATLALLAPRPWPAKRLLAAGLGIWIVILGVFWLNAHERFGQGIVQEDKSISHRLAIWRCSPQMLAANPQGWGWNESGQAYMDWFQPLDRHENYGSLVNTHLSKVVELGIFGGSLYLFLWATVLLAGWPSEGSRWRAVPFAILAGFGTAALFTNMARDPSVWILPALCVAAIFVDRLFRREAPNWGHIFAAGLACFSVVFALYFIGKSGERIVSVSNKVAFVGGNPEYWIVMDAEKFRSYPRHLRKFLAEHPGTSFAVVKSVLDLPDNPQKGTKKPGTPVLIMKDTDVQERGMLLKKVTSATFLAPQFTPSELPDQLQAQAIYGEFSNSRYAVFWDEQKLSRRIPGISDFIPDWTTNLLAPFLAKSDGE
ncbi:MAG: O-antigen ligase family protein [Chthoniobacterales bacterium]|nr:O-antigen ligase family protein [Chthoniobacterales bacterium]